MREIVTWIGIGLIFILVFVLVTLVMWAALSPVLRADCIGQTKDIGLPSRWLYFGGCQVYEDNKWIPLENWRYFGE